MPSSTIRGLTTTEASEGLRNNITVTRMLMRVPWAVIIFPIYIHFIALMYGSRVDTPQPIFWHLIGSNSTHQYIVTGSISTTSISSSRKSIGTIDVICVWGRVRILWSKPRSLNLDPFTTLVRTNIDADSLQIDILGGLSTSLSHFGCQTILLIRDAWFLLLGFARLAEDHESQVIGR
jgi:hypothetical protein